MGRPGEVADKFKNETPKEYFIRVMIGQMNGEEWAMNLAPFDMEIVNANTDIKEAYEKQRKICDWRPPYKED